MTQFNTTEARALVDDLQLVAKCLKGGNKFPTGQSVILEAADTLTAALAEIERLETQIRSLDHALNFILSDAAWTPKHPACESIIACINALRKGDDQ